MGICCSSNTAVSFAAAAPPLTAKLVLEDGSLQEFSRSVKVSEILWRFQGSPAAPAGGKSQQAFFVCDADGMGMEGAVSALGAEEELKAGELYFLLPLSMMRKQLRPQDMAELAVKASSALIKSASGISPLVFPEVGGETRSMQRSAAAKKVRYCGRRVKRGASRRYFNAELGVIPEYVELEEEEEERNIECLMC